MSILLYMLESGVAKFTVSVYQEIVYILATPHVLPKHENPIPPFKPILFRISFYGPMAKYIYTRITQLIPKNLIRARTAQSW